MMSKQKKLLGGPGAEALREFDFGPDGLVARARTEADQVIAHVDEIAALNPRLVLTITSVKTLKVAQALGKVSLAPIYFVDFGWITGTHGGMNLNDKWLGAVAPALENVRHLQLSCRGSAEKCFSPSGLRALAPHLTSLRYLALDFYPVELPPLAEYVQSILESVPTLRAVDIEGADLPTRLIKTGLLEGGMLTRAVRAQIGQGREFVDQLEAALA